MTEQNTPQTPDFSPLKQLDLRENAIACYGALYMNGAQTASQLATAIGRPRTSVYHALEQLEAKGFVNRDKLAALHEVTHFEAVRLDKALENLAIYQRQAVRELVDFQIEESIRRQTVIEARIIDRDWR